MGYRDVVVLLLPLLCIGGSVFVPELIRVPVGQPFIYELRSTKRMVVQDASGEELPTWLTWNASGSVLEGVPQPSSIGETYVRVTEENGTDAVLEIRVSEEVTNPCGDEQKTLWMELAFNEHLKDLSIEQQMQIANNIAEYVEVNISLMRIYTNQYKEEIRRSEVVESGMEREPSPEDATLLWKVACSDLDDDATEILEKVLSLMDDDTGFQWKIVGWKLTRGSILSRKQRHEGALGGVLSQFPSAFATNEPELETEATPTTTTRITRSTKRADNPPVRLNSLPTFHCKRGAVCELIIPTKTFVDAEDGDTNSLTLSVYPIVAEKNWLVVDRSRQILRGIPLNQGDFEFRLEARDSANQMTSAAFRVSVEEAQPSNHLFIFDIQKSYEQLTKDPETMLAFVTKLANSLGDRLPKNILIRSVETKNNERSIISWSNSSLSHKICQKKAIETLKYMMLTRRRDRVRNEFLRAMDSRFHVRNIQLQLRDSCLEMTTVAPSITSSSISTSAQPAFSSFSSLLWISIALASVFLLLLIVLILVCCISKYKHQKTVQSEYVSKGLPVVFPEEIPQEDDSATVATPMLVREERPPLIITQHDNHLYKPPPPLSSTSSPRPRSATTNQRLPPPYVP
uniref:Peptidase S72 domain-containing protein n=1 Tax=Parascaris univalens TaxID=6257 RepID=A0A915BI89_PARUN